jgi:hypothetical protein
VSSMVLFQLTHLLLRLWSLWWPTNLYCKQILDLLGNRGWSMFLFPLVLSFHRRACNQRNVVCLYGYFSLSLFYLNAMISSSCVCMAILAFLYSILMQWYAGCSSCVLVVVKSKCHYSIYDLDSSFLIINGLLMSQSNNVNILWILVG